MKFYKQYILKLIDMAGLSDEKLGAAAAEYMSGLKEE